ncbi:MAG: hypothetical protein KOO63_05745 [Bacteroidales bacterium]|nr:hypothetical protein [Candidatus Latescibacterota bacterium]
MDRNEKLARALEMYTKYQPSKGCKCPCWYDKDGNEIVRDGDLEAYFNSPAGREAVREKVREEWVHGESIHPRQVVQYDRATGTQIELQEHVDGSWQVTEDEGYFSSSATALLWLAERKVRDE